MSDKITRRLFVGSMGVASIAPASALLAPPRAAAGERIGSAEPAGLKPTYTFFNSAEAQFIEAACERLIPNWAVRGATESACIAAVRGSQEVPRRDTNCPLLRRNSSVPR